jgi:hypothetical protein
VLQRHVKTVEKPVQAVCGGYPQRFGVLAEPFVGPVVGSTAVGAGEVLVGQSAFADEDPQVRDAGVAAEVGGLRLGGWHVDGGGGGQVQVAQKHDSRHGDASFLVGRIR